MHENEGVEFSCGSSTDGAILTIGESVIDTGDDDILALTERLIRSAGCPLSVASIAIGGPRVWGTAIDSRTPWIMIVEGRFSPNNDVLDALATYLKGVAASWDKVPSRHRMADLAVSQKRGAVIIHRGRDVVEIRLTNISTEPAMVENLSESFETARQKTNVDTFVEAISRMSGDEKLFEEENVLAEGMAYFLKSAPPAVLNYIAFLKHALDKRGLLLHFKLAAVEFLGLLSIWITHETKSNRRDRWADLIPRASFKRRYPYRVVMDCVGTLNFSPSLALRYAFEVMADSDHLESIWHSKDFPELHSTILVEIRPQLPCIRDPALIERWKTLASMLDNIWNSRLTVARLLRDEPSTAYKRWTCWVVAIFLLLSLSANLSSKILQIRNLV